MLDFGIVSPALVGTMEPSSTMPELASLWEGLLAPAVHQRFRYNAYGSQSELELAFAGGQVHAMIADRNHSYTPPYGTRRLALRERWVGMLVLNAEAPLFADPQLRRDFGLMAQALAQTLFPRRVSSWTCSPTYYTSCFMPDGLLPESYYRRNDMSVAPVRFAARWREHFATHPLRVLYTPHRGALTRLLDLLITELRGQGLALDVIETSGAPDVYSRVALGEFDLVPRGWAERDAESAGFTGAFEKQAPGELGKAVYARFHDQIAGLDPQGDPRHGELYAGALRALEDHWLFVPFCQDRTRLLYRLPS